MVFVMFVIVFEIFFILFILDLICKLNWFLGFGFIVGLMGCVGVGVGVGCIGFICWCFFLVIFVMDLFICLGIGFLLVSGERLIVL